MAELAALDPAHAKLLGLGSVGYRTLIRWEDARRRFGLVGCADDRWLRRSGGTRTVSEEVREAVLAVREETKRMAKVSMRTKDRVIRQYVREEFGPGTKVPSYDTLRVTATGAHDIPRQGRDAARGSVRPPGTGGSSAPGSGRDPPARPAGGRAGVAGRCPSSGSRWTVPGPRSRGQRFSDCSE
ncbi:hypothetical protein Shyhy01_17510 [Streptomyces hygroscopicus subsp. hygroscopicus]|nr:hypothetical protein Shyhy01_17510 [Streptomyces hygroscopicus subsp. hygroscopicus]